MKKRAEPKASIALQNVLDYPSSCRKMGLNPPNKKEVSQWLFFS